MYHKLMNYLDKLATVDRAITDREKELTQLRSQRAQLTRDAIDSGFTQYRIAQHLHRNQSSISSWLKQ